MAPTATTQPPRSRIAKSKSLEILPTIELGSTRILNKIGDEEVTETVAVGVAKRKQAQPKRRVALKTLEQKQQHQQKRKASDMVVGEEREDDGDDGEKAVAHPNKKRKTNSLVDSGYDSGAETEEFEPPTLEHEIEDDGQDELFRLAEVPQQQQTQPQPQQQQQQQQQQQETDQRPCQQEEKCDSFLDEFFKGITDNETDTMLNDAMIQAESTRIDDGLPQNGQGMLNPFVMADNEYRKTTFNRTFLKDIYDTKWCSHNDKKNTYTIPYQGVTSHMVRVISDNDVAKKITIQKKFTDQVGHYVPKIEMSVEEARDFLKHLKDVVGAATVQQPIVRRVPMYQNGVNEVTLSRQVVVKGDIFRYLTITQDYPEADKKFEMKTMTANSKLTNPRKVEVTVQIPWTEQGPFFDCVREAIAFADFLQTIDTMKKKTFLEVARHYANRVGKCGKLTLAGADYYNHVLYTFATLEGVPLAQNYPAGVVLREFLDGHKDMDYAIVL